MIKPHFVICGEKCMLGPYQSKFAPLYHSWMQDSQLLELTSSQPLTLDQQLENCRSWAKSSERHTFLIYDPTVHCQASELGTPVGDINFFFGEWLQPDEFQINVMIAEKNARGRGLAAEAVQLVIAHVSSRFKRNTCLAKIKDGNSASSSLFIKLGFGYQSFSQIFKQHLYKKGDTRQVVLKS